MDADYSDGFKFPWQELQMWGSSKIEFKHCRNEECKQRKHNILIKNGDVVEFSLN